MQVGSDCLSIYFIKPQGFDFTPGECADLSFEDQSVYFKTFSFSSSPTEDYLVITFRRGITEYKSRLAKLRIGDVLLMRIYGNTFNYLPEHKAIFIAGGIGITPFRSMLVFEKIQKKQKNYPKYPKITKDDITLIYLNNNEEFIFKNELNTLQRELNNLKIHYIVTQKEGRLTKEKLEEIVSFDNDTVSYISGPPGFVDATIEILESMHINNIRIKTDSFDGYLEEY